MKPLVSEKDICNTIIEFLNYQGAYCWRVNAGGASKEHNGKKYFIRLAKKGTSDIIGLYKGRFFALEVKKPTTLNTVTDAQQEFLEKITHFGGIAAVVSNPEEALAIIRS